MSTHTAKYLRDMAADRDNTNLTREDVAMLQDAADCLDEIPDDVKITAIEQAIRGFNSDSTFTPYQALELIAGILNDGNPNGPLLIMRDEASDAITDDDGCPVNDPECLSNDGECHDACTNPLRLDYPVDRLKMVADAMDKMNAQECDPIETLEVIAGALYGEEVYITPDDAIDAMKDDPELNAVADTRTTLDAMDSTGGRFRTAEFAAIVHAIEVCDAYIALRAHCPRGAVVVRPALRDYDGKPVEYLTDDDEPTTLFDVVVGALEFAEIHAYVEVLGEE